MITSLLLASFYASIELRRVKRPEIQKCSSLTLSKFVKMLYIIIDYETENFSSISNVLYEIRPIEIWYPIAVINVCSFLAIF